MWPLRVLLYIPFEDSIADHTSELIIAVACAICMPLDEGYAGFYQMLFWGLVGIAELSVNCCLLPACLCCMRRCRVRVSNSLLINGGSFSDGIDALRASIYFSGTNKNFF